MHVNLVLHTVSVHIAPLVVGIGHIFNIAARAGGGVGCMEFHSNLDLKRGKTPELGLWLREVRHGKYTALDRACQAARGAPQSADAWTLPPSLPASFSPGGERPAFSFILGARRPTFNKVVDLQDGQCISISLPLAAPRKRWHAPQYTRVFPMLRNCI